MSGSIQVALLGRHIQEGVIDTHLVRPMPVHRQLQLSSSPRTRSAI
jgi:hypothetical protein